MKGNELPSLFEDATGGQIEEEIRDAETQSANARDIDLKRYGGGATRLDKGPYGMGFPWNLKSWSS